MRAIDPKDITLTPQIVATYQEIYYTYYKPLALLANPDDPKMRQVFMDKFKPILDKHQWSWKYFEALLSIDMMQRLVYDCKFKNPEHKMTPYPEYRHLDPNHGALRLKCLSRTEDPDPQFH